MANDFVSLDAVIEIIEKNAVTPSEIANAHYLVDEIRKLPRAAVVPKDYHERCMALEKAGNEGGLQLFKLMYQLNKRPL